MASESAAWTRHGPQSLRSHRSIGRLPRVDLAAPSYIRKANRAEQHIIDLTQRLAVFAGKHPYTVTDPVKNKRGERFSYLEFTESPDHDVGLIAGDIIYNLRASFDYLVGSLVPSGERSKVLCPVLHEPVWEIPHVTTENKQRTKDRERWHSLTRHVRSTDAIVVLKDLMPLDSRRKPPEEHPLDLINRLSNKDRHQRLPIITWGLGQVRAKVVLKGSGQIVPAEIPGWNPTHRGFKNNASIPVPDGVVYVKLRGTPVVLIRIGEERSNFIIPGVFWDMLNWLRNEAFSRLGSYSKSGA
jgi:hypothetical protein